MQKNNFFWYLTPSVNFLKFSIFLQKLTFLENQKRGHFFTFLDTLVSSKKFQNQEKTRKLLKYIYLFYTKYIKNYIYFNIDKYNLLTCIFYVFLVFS